MFLTLIFFIPVAMIFNCYAAYHGNDSLRSKSRIVILAIAFLVEMSIVPSGFSFAEAVAFWIEPWNIPFYAPFLLFLVGGILLTKSAPRWRFLLGMACFTVGIIVQIVSIGYVILLFGQALLPVSGFLRARAVLFGKSSPKTELAGALCFGLSQFLTVFCFCAMAAASV